MFESYTNNLKKSNYKKLILKLLIDILIIQSNIIKQIKIIYSKNNILQRIIKIEQTSKRKTLINIT